MSTSSPFCAPNLTQFFHPKKAESLFVVVILQQQKMINKLIAKVSERKKRSSGKLTEWMDPKVP
jgi:hypothetical protein